MARTPKIVPFQGNDGLWYWRLLAGNGKSIMVAGEGFASKGNAKRSALRVVELAAQAEFVDD